LVQFEAVVGKYVEQTAAAAVLRQYTDSAPRSVLLPGESVLRQYTDGARVNRGADECVQIVVAHLADLCTVRTTGSVT